MDEGRKTAATCWLKGSSLKSAGLCWECRQGMRPAETDQAHSWRGLYQGLLGLEFLAVKMPGEGPAATNILSLLPFIFSFDQLLPPRPSSTVARPKRMPWAMNDPTCKAVH